MPYTSLYGRIAFYAGESSQIWGYAIEEDKYYKISQKYDTNITEIKVNDITKSKEFIGSIKNGRKFTLFANNLNGAITMYSKVKVKKFWYKKDGVLIADYVPCYRITDNVVGMYDLVTGEFLTNSGTGEFNKGNKLSFEDVLIDPTKIEYTSLTDDKKIVNVKAHVRWNDDEINNKMDNNEDTEYTKEKSTLGYKATVKFEQYIDVED